MSVFTLDVSEDSPKAIKDIYGSKFPYPFNKLIPPTQISNEEYHALDGISASGLKQARKDPKLYMKKRLLKRLPSPALEMGTALHEALLEPEVFQMSNYDLTPANKLKLEVMINNGKVMFDYIVNKTMNEYSLFVKDNGFIRKVRVDAYDPILGIIYDVKSTRYNSEKKFANDAYDLGYHLQSAFYLDTFKLAGLKASAFAFLCVPSETPNEPYPYQSDDNFIEDGRSEYTDVVSRILDYGETNEDVFFRQLSLPQWRLKQLQIVGE